MSSKWGVAYHNKKQGMTAVCTEGQGGNYECGTDAADGAALTWIDVPGPMVCVNVDFRDKHGIENIQFGYINMETGGVEWTNWAFSGIKTWSNEMACVENGIIIGMSVNITSDGSAAGDLQ